VAAVELLLTDEAAAPVPWAAGAAFVLAAVKRQAQSFEKSLVAEVDGFHNMYWPVMEAIWRPEAVKLTCCALDVGCVVPVVD
jgi:hypothetical protein